MCTGSLYQKTAKHQFDYLCIKSLKGEAANYIKAMDCRQKKEILFSEMTQAQLEELDWEDDYNVYKTSFNILDYEILVEDEDLAEALGNLSRQKQVVVFLFYFMEMNESEIARSMQLAKSTVNEHHRRSIELLRQALTSDD